MTMMLCACTSTQTTAARLQLNDDRIRASEVPVKVAGIGTSTTVTATSVTALTGAGHVTVVVGLTNHAAEPTSDLPLIIGYHRGSHTVYLNAGAQSSYFNNHIPAIAGHGTLDWVDVANVSRLPKGTKLFALIGADPASPVGSGWKAPAITTTVTHAGSGGPLSVTVKNTSGISQYLVPVYAVVTQNGRIITAGVSSIAALNGGAKAVVKLALAGDANGTLQVEAPGTIFK